jgi:hypothetical protein
MEKKAYVKEEARLIFLLSRIIYHLDAPFPFLPLPDLISLGARRT